MSEASPVDLRINYLWLMLLRTGVATSTNGRHSGCSALGPTREGSIKIHPERSIGAAIHHLERSELIETGRIETILRHMASYSHFQFQLQNLGMSFICLNMRHVAFDSNSTCGVRNNTTHPRSRAPPEGRRRDRPPLHCWH